MNGRTKRRLWDTAVTLTALLLGLLIVFPVLYGLFGAFKSAEEFSSYPPTLLPASFGYLENFAEVIRTVPIPRYFLNSLIVAAMGSTVKLVLALLAAYAFAFFEFRGKHLLFFMLLGTMMLPEDTLLVTNYQTVSRLGLTDTYLGMCIVGFVGASQMFMLRQAFLSTPTALREASQLDGCGDLRFICSILVPVSRPLLMTLFTQSFVTGWNAYLWPLLVTNHNEMRTIQVGITMLTGVEDTNYHVVLAGVVISLLPALLLFLILRKNITQAMTAGSLVG